MLNNNRRCNLGYFRQILGVSITYFEASNESIYWDSNVTYWGCEVGIKFSVVTSEIGKGMVLVNTPLNLVVNRCIDIRIQRTLSRSLIERCSR